MTGIKVWNRSSSFSPTAVRSAVDISGRDNRLMFNITSANDAITTFVAIKTTYSHKNTHIISSYRMNFERLVAKY